MSNTFRPPLGKPSCMLSFILRVIVKIIIFMLVCLYLCHTLCPDEHEFNWKGNHTHSHISFYLTPKTELSFVLPISSHPPFPCPQRNKESISYLLNHSSLSSSYLVLLMHLPKHHQLMEPLPPPYHHHHQSMTISTPTCHLYQEPPSPTKTCHHTTKTTLH